MAYSQINNHLFNVAAYVMASSSLWKININVNIEKLDMSALINVNIQ